MKNNVEALKDVYKALGGELSDTYDDIADGESVGNYVLTSDVVQAVSKKATAGGGGSDTFTAYCNADFGNKTGELVTPWNDIVEAYENGKNIQLVLGTNTDSGKITMIGKTSMISDESGLYYIAGDYTGLAPKYNDATKITMERIGIEITGDDSVTVKYDSYEITMLPAVTSSNEGEVLTVDDQGKWVSADVPAELPDVTATDNGDVLKVVDGAWAKASS